jgi:hypothetical protein
MGVFFPFIFAGALLQGHDIDLLNVG